MARHAGPKFAFTSTTGFVHWKTDDLTDLDYSPAPLLTRNNAEKDTQFTQEFRFASAPGRRGEALGRGVVQVAGRPVPLLAELRPGRGEQLRAVRAVPVPSVSRLPACPQAALDDTGVGVYGSGTFAVNEKLDVTLGARFDHENRKADLADVLRRARPSSRYRPSSIPKSRSRTSRRRRPCRIASSPTRWCISPSPAASRPAASIRRHRPGTRRTTRRRPGTTKADSRARGTAGRSPPTSPCSRSTGRICSSTCPTRRCRVSSTSTTWGRRAAAGWSWSSTSGHLDGCLLFGTLGVTRARFGDGTKSSGGDVSDKEIPNTPGYTASSGVELGQPVGKLERLYGRAEVVLYGAFKYDDFNMAGRTRIRSRTSALARARSACSSRAGSGMRSTRNTCPVAFQYDHGSRRRASSARAAGPGRSASPRESRSER